MRFLRFLLPAFLFVFIALAPQVTFAATATFFGPIFPSECNCPGSAPDFKCVLATLENGMNFAISVGVIIFVLVAAYAGFLWMFAPINARNRELGRSILTNAVIGLLIALSAWLIVDFIMKTLYNEQWGPWHSILGNKGNACLVVHTPPAASVGATPTFEAGQHVECALVPARPNDRFPGTVTASRIVDDGNPSTPSADMVTVAFEGNTTEGTPIGTFEVQASICRRALDTSIAGGFQVGSHVECNKGNQGTYLPAVVNGISDDPGGGNPRVSVCYDNQTRAQGGCEDLIPASQCRLASTTGIPPNGSVAEGGSCANNTRACQTGLRCETAAGANKDKCVAETTTGTSHPFTLVGINQGQRNHAAPQLSQLISCMESKPSTQGAKITSISDDALFSGKTWAECRAGGRSAGCAHTSNSWHYGGANGQDKSLAVDFGNNSNSTSLRQALEVAACQCNSSVRILQEGGGPIGTALHISFGVSEGRGCQ